MKILPIAHNFYSSKSNFKNNNKKVENNQRPFDLGTFSTLKHEILFKGTTAKVPPLKITLEREKQLQAFQEKYGLKFNNINTLNQAFMYGTTPEGISIHHINTYQRLEFIGDDVLELCVNKLFSDNLPQCQEGELTKLKQQTITNENISRYSRKLGLDKMTLSTQNPTDKRTADVFEALLGAIFVDGGEDGFKNAYRFFEENLKDDVLYSRAQKRQSSKALLEGYIINKGKDPDNLKFITTYSGGIYDCRVYFEDELLSAHQSKGERKAQHNAFRQALLILKEKFENN